MSFLCQTDKQSANQQHQQQQQLHQQNLQHQQQQQHLQRPQPPPSHQPPPSATGTGGQHSNSPLPAALEATGGRIKDTLRQSFDPFPSRRGLAERTPLIRHAGPRPTPEELQRQQNAERSTSNTDNQAFLGECVAQVLAGEGVGWLRLSRLRKLMEDESYRTLVLGKLNRTLERRIAPDDHIDDVCVSKPVWKGMVKCLQAAAHGLEATYANFGLGGMASVFQLMEIAHTHYWSKDLAEAAGGGGGAGMGFMGGVADLGASLLSSRSHSPAGGSRENLHSPAAAAAAAAATGEAEVADWGPPGSSRKGSMVASAADVFGVPAQMRRASDVAAVDAVQQQQTTSEMFKDMLSQKRNMFLSKLSSFDSEVSGWGEERTQHAVGRLICDSDAFWYFFEAT